MLFKYIKVRGWTLSEISNFELLAGYLSLHGGVSGHTYDAFKEKIALIKSKGNSEHHP